MLEKARLALLWISVAGYLLVAARLIATRLWLRYPLFTLLLVADAANVGIVGPWNTTWIPPVEYCVTTLKLLVAWEAFTRATEFSTSNLRQYMQRLFYAVILAAALLTVGMYGPSDPLDGIKSYRQFAHTGLAVAGVVLMLFCWLYQSGSDPDSRDAWHCSLLVIWFSAVTVAMLTKPGPGEMVKWQWANCGYRAVVIGCLWQWWRVLR